MNNYFILKDISLQKLQVTENTVLRKPEEKERAPKQETIKHQKEMQQAIKDYEDKVPLLIFHLLTDYEEK